MRDTTMKPARPILDQTFRYVPAVATSVADTWRRFGWRPMTDEERKERVCRATAIRLDCGTVLVLLDGFAHLHHRRLVSIAVQESTIGAPQ